MSTSDLKRAYHHGNLRETLIAAGIEALESHPGTEPSLRDLARRAGVSPNAVYRHFSDKDALLVALAIEGFRLFREEADAAEAGEDPGDRQGLLRVYGVSYVLAATRRPALFRLMFGRFGAVPHGAELDEAKEIMFERLRRRVAESAGVPIDHPSVKTGTLYAWSLVHGFANLALDGQIEGDLGEQIVRVLSLPDAAPHPQSRTAPK